MVYIDQIWMVKTPDYDDCDTCKYSFCDFHPIRQMECILAEYKLEALI